MAAKYFKNIISTSRDMPTSCVGKSFQSLFNCLQVPWPPAELKELSQVQVASKMNQAFINHFLEWGMFSSLWSM